MKIKFTAFSLCLLIFPFANAQTISTDNSSPALHSIEDSASYAFGIKLGHGLKNDSLPGMKADIFIDALRSMLYDQKVKLNASQADSILTRYIQQIDKVQSKVPEEIYKDLLMFETPMALKLKKNVRKSDIDKMYNVQLKETALALLNKNYHTQYRVGDYTCYLTPTILGQELMIGDGYSKYEGITGIYMPVAKHIVLVDGITDSSVVNLLVPNWNRHAPEGTPPDKDPAGWGIYKQEFQLHNGVNIIDIRGGGGLAYIGFYSEDPEKEKLIKVHFVNGRVNGYFDLSKNNDVDWNTLINNAVYPVIDAKGRHIQIAYPAEACKRYAYNRGVELIRNYDSMVSLQHRLLGLIKYNRVPKNHILARVNYNYYMFRDGDGVAYMGTDPSNAMPLVVDPSRVIKGDPCWGFSHEVGHVHQLHPYFNWGGLGEVSNNIFSLFNTTHFGTTSRLSEQKNYQKARDSIITRKICYLQDNDVFDRLVPFWQLQLYFSRQGNNKDFYPDLFEAFRKQGAAENQDKQGSQRDGGWGARGDNPAQYQLNFIKTACEVSKTDLTDFFDKYGFFYLGKFEVSDYGNYSYLMSKEMADKCKVQIKEMNLPKPKVDISRLED